MPSVPYFMEFPWNSQKLTQYPKIGENRRWGRELRVAGDGAAIRAPVSELWWIEGGVLVVPHLLVKMSRRKSAAHKSADNPSDNPPLSLSRLPLRKWFNSKEILKSYLDIFSKLPVLKPKYLSEGLLSEDKYEVF
ncbi:hypothetical protein PIB30_063706 [Stylosanthes scabra]|uniref:Uncharacterized protein n=1 Tax=Stylosanthes scabra TaxID=79078 RepID=A0ABU6QLC6_9FABA|nr:hypothetical protein [Stylosanthes scabra]